MTNISILAKNIKRIRAVTNLNLQQAATNAGLSRLAYSNIEQGKSEPKTSTLQNIAQALGVNITEFFTTPPAFQTLRFRIMKETSTKITNIRELEIIRFGKWLSDFCFLEKLMNNHAEFRLDLIETKKADYAAQEVRKKLKLEAGAPISDIGNLLEKSGVKLYLRRFPLQKFFGLSLGEKDGGPAIAVNVDEEIPIERQIFTVAHELGHILLHRNSFKTEILQEDEKEEKQADAFASSFLMPENAFLKKWEETAGLHWIDRVLHVKRFFKVSYRTVLMRLIETGKTDKDIFQKFAVDYKNKYAHDLKNHYEPDALEEPDRLLKSDFMADRLNRLVREAVEKEIISQTKGAEILGTSAEVMRDLMLSWNF